MGPPPGRGKKTRNSKEKKPANQAPPPGRGKKTRNSKEKKPANRTSRGPSPWQRKKNPQFERKETREPYFQRAQSLAKEKKPGIRKKKNPRIVLPEGPVPGKGKKTRNSKGKKPANRNS